MSGVRMVSDWRKLFFLVICSGIGLGGFLLASQLTLRLGFPLDDAWIHQTYARNLAQSGEWAFNPGVLSAGSTAPLWSLFLAIGYLAHLAPYPWTYLLGWASLAGLAWIGELFGRNLFPKTGSSIPWIGVFLAGEWHLVWASGSGMETVLFALVILLLFWWISRFPLVTFWAGFICGVSIWLRPDGLTLAGPIGFVLALNASDWKTRGRGLLLALGGILIGGAPYLFFNQALGGNWWPNTFFAKQAEYAIRLQEPYLLRFSRLINLPLIGAGIALVPGLLYSVWIGWTRKQWAILGAVLWWVGYTGIYAAVLPVDYQHGRYLMPAMPVYFVLGAGGTLALFRRMNTARQHRLIRFGWAIILGITWILFYGQGAATYATDVAIIETEMVATGQWIADTVEPNALIAVHDIGAIGYFGKHRIVDLAGLVSPEVIPFIRDEEKLSDYLTQQKVDYLVTFPGWYPALVQKAEPIFQTQGQFSLLEGGENMTVYRWIGNQKEK